MGFPRTQYPEIQTRKKKYGELLPLMTMGLLQTMCKLIESCTIDPKLKAQAKAGNRDASMQHWMCNVSILE